jgi:hypothetical protein
MRGILNKVSSLPHNGSIDFLCLLFLGLSVYQFEERGPRRVNTHLHLGFKSYLYKPVL